LIAVQVADAPRTVPLAVSYMHLLTAIFRVIRYFRVFRVFKSDMTEWANSLDTRIGPSSYCGPLIEDLSFISQIIRSVIIFGLRKAFSKSAR
jgi:hypothetical protein